MSRLDDPCYTCGYPGLLEEAEDLLREALPLIPEGTEVRAKVQRFLEEANDE